MAAAMPASRLMLEVAIVIIGLLLLVFLSGTLSIVLGGYLLSIKTTTTLPLEVICYSVGFAIGAFYGNYSLTKKADAAISFILTLVFFMGAVSAWSSSKTNATEEYSRDLEDIIQKFWTPDVISIEYDFKSLNLAMMNPSNALTNQTSLM